MRSQSLRALAWAGIFSALGLVMPGQVIGQSAEGIKVHGHWVIEVRDADGTLHERRAFENALTVLGKQTLVNLLGGKQGPITRWRVYLYGSGSTIDDPCLKGCLIYEPAVTLSIPTISDGSFSLHAQTTAETDGNVGHVQAQTSISTAFSLSTFDSFTAATISPAVPVQATQTISVTVTFSFQ
jgi:hypothetical protein